MRFTVIIPVYNCKDCLAATVDSVLASGLSDYEILLIDDGSTDGTAAVCDTLAEAHDGVRCIHQANAGVSAARNRGIEAAAGEYILFFDADDSVDPGALAHSCEIVREIGPDMLVFGMSFDYYFHGRLYRRDESVYERECLLDGNAWRTEFEKLYTCNALSPVWNKFIRRQILTENGIRFCRDLIEMEDFLFSVRCLACCGSVYMLPEAIYRYRQAENERSTFNRLLRIPSLTAYMAPFEDAARNLDIPELETVVSQIYRGFLHEMLLFGSPAQIAAAAEGLLAGRYASFIQKTDPAIYEQLAAKQYRGLYRRGVKQRLRHWLAVRVKSMKNRWRRWMNIQDLLGKLFVADRYFTIALRRRGESILRNRRFQAEFVVPANRRSWVADPMLAQDGDRTWLFYEAVEGDHGHIEVAEVLDDCTLGAPKVILKDNCHYSYPFVFRHQDQWYMIPESSAAGEVRLYRAVDFPAQWEICCVLLREKAVDTTVFESDGQHYLLTYCPVAGTERVIPHAYQLTLDGADSHVSEIPWEIFDDLRVRGAGPLFEAEGDLIRPAQISRELAYGDGVAFYRAEPGKTYRERFCGELRPEQLRIPGYYVDGLHTYCRSGKFEAIDVRCGVIDYFKVFRKVLGVFRR